MILAGELQFQQLQKKSLKYYGFDGIRNPASHMEGSVRKPRWQREKKRLNEQNNGCARA